jgi:hypothetical protein
MNQNSGVSMSHIYKYIAEFFFTTTLIFGFLYSYDEFKIQRIETEKNTLKINLENCNKGIKEFNDAQIRAGNTIEKVREVVKTVKSDCDCYHNSVDKPILERVRNKK